MSHEDITSKTKRRSLAPRREPYWMRLSNGLYVGYRVLTAGEGTWIGRLRGDDGKQKTHSLGIQPDYDTAVRAVNEWAAALQQGVEIFDTTVGDACRSYVSHLRLQKSTSSSRDAEGRFKSLVYGQRIEKILLAKLRTDHLRDWLNAQVIDPDEEDDDPDALRRSKVSANRNLDSLKAALNLALRERLVATDAGWATVYRFSGVKQRRELFLTLAERQSLLAACPPNLAALCTAMLLTAARPGELAKANIGSFDPSQGTLVLDGKTGRRTISLSSAAMAFFNEQSQGHSGQAPLLRREYGERWDKDAWKKIFKRAAHKAGLPDETVLYSLRHAAISELVAGGMDIFLVAKVAGTSSHMIDKYYGHLRHERTRAVMDAIKML